MLKQLKKWLRIGHKKVMICPKCGGCLSFSRNAGAYTQENAISYGLCYKCDECEEEYIDVKGKTKYRVNKLLDEGDELPEIYKDYYGESPEKIDILYAVVSVDSCKEEAE